MNGICSPNPIKQDCRKRAYLAYDVQSRRAKQRKGDKPTTNHNRYLRFQIVAADTSPPRLILHHATTSPPPSGVTREHTTASSSASSTSGNTESEGTTDLLCKQWPRAQDQRKGQESRTREAEETQEKGRVGWGRRAAAPSLAQTSPAASGEEDAQGWELEHSPAVKKP